MIATEFENELPRTLRHIIRGLGSRETNRSDMIATLLFQPRFIRKMIEIGESDGCTARAEIARLPQRWSRNSASSASRPGPPGRVIGHLSTEIPLHINPDARRRNRGRVLRVQTSGSADPPAAGSSAPVSKGSFKPGHSHCHVDFSAYPPLADARSGDRPRAAGPPAASLPSRLRAAVFRALPPRIRRARAVRR